MSSIRPVENLDTAAAASGKVVLEKLNRLLGQRDITARELSQALIPLYGISGIEMLLILLGRTRLISFSPDCEIRPFPGLNMAVCRHFSRRRMPQHVPFHLIWWSGEC